jgi:beta-lactamase superfamily II metal-dependent hydrolase
MADDRSRPPDSDTLEVSVFGPGKGECIVVHVPGGYWFAVDSLRVRSDHEDAEGGKEPVVVHYLRLLKAELRAFFITHWHEDHTAGAAEVLRAFASASSSSVSPAGTGSASSRRSSPICCPTRRGSSSCAISPPSSARSSSRRSRRSGGSC